MKLPRHAPAVLVMAIAVAVYLNSLANAFVYDDHDLVQMNASIRDVAHVGSLFTNDLFRGDSNYYRPLPGLVFAVVYRVAGPTPWAFRCVNIALHALASLLVFRLIRDLFRDRPQSELAALAGGLLFAAHPVHVEAVAWVSGIMDVACAALALLAFDLYRRADESPHGRARLAAGLVAFCLSLLAKETAAVLPLLLVLYEAAFPRSRSAHWRSGVVRLAPWFVTLGAYLALRAVAIGAIVPHGRPNGSALIVADLFVRYVRTVFVPAALSIGHFATPPDSWVTPRGLAAMALLLAAATLAGLGWRHERGMFLGVAIFAVTLAPALALSGLGPPVSKLYSDRYLYLPSAGMAVVVAAVLAMASGGWKRRSRLVWVAAVAAGAWLGAATVRQNRVWRSDLSLWADAIEKYPGDGTNHFYYGNACLSAGDDEAAKRAFERASAVDPNLVNFYLGQGQMLTRLRMPLKAVFYFDRVLALDPNSFDALLGAADACNAAGWTDLAARRYRAAIALHPDSAVARNGFGFLLANSGQLDAAIEQFEAAVRAAPDDPVPLRNLAVALGRRGDGARAAELRARADALAPR